MCLTLSIFFSVPPASKGFNKTLNILPEQGYFPGVGLNKGTLHFLLLCSLKLWVLPLLPPLRSCLCLGEEKDKGKVLNNPLSSYLCIPSWPSHGWWFLSSIHPWILPSKWWKVTLGVPALAPETDHTQHSSEKWNECREGSLKGQCRIANSFFEWFWPVVCPLLIMLLLLI